MGVGWVWGGWTRGYGRVAGCIRRRSIRAATALEIVSGKVGELAGEHALQTGELPHTETDWDNGIAGQRASGAEDEALQVAGQRFLSRSEGFEEKGIDLGLDGAKRACGISGAWKVTR